MNPYTAAGVGAGLQQGLSNYETAKTNRRKMQMAEKQFNMQMQGMQSEQQLRDMKIQAMETQMKQDQLNQARKEAINAMLATSETGNVAYANSMLDNPVMKQLMGNRGIVRYHALSDYSPGKLQALGWEWKDEADAQGWMVAEGPDGSLSLSSAEGELLNMGGFDLLSKSRQDHFTNMLRGAQARQTDVEADYKEMQGNLADKFFENNPEATWGDWTSKRSDIGGSGAGDSFFKKTYFDIYATKGKDAADNWAYEYINQPTASQKELKAVDAVKSELETSYPEFYNTTWEPGTPEYRGAEKQVQKLERLLKIKPSASAVKEMAEIKTLVKQFTTASNLKPSDVGIMDNFFKNVGKYISKAPESASRVAYNQAMMGLRNATIGATMSPAEMAAFTGAYGSLYQQEPAIREALRQGLIGLREKLSTYAETGDSAVTHFRLGMDQSKLDTAITNLDKLLGVVDNPEAGDVVPTAKTVSEAPSAMPAPKEGYSIAHNPETGEYILVKDK